ncbi:MAG: L-ribulose-5-phosphate 3-epimerase [Spirochaetaceae bacterium]|jgi:L-ribulose-5-phosphate 3-epimerase|nr:L-ribulose-5-phosphate 3-epimerase [Spirochaetaceae bacterium]
MKEYLIGLYEKAMPPALSWKEKLETAKSAGYDFVEMSIDETDEKLARLTMSGPERFTLVKEMYDAKMPIMTMCLSGHRKYPLGSEDPAIRARSLTIMEDAIKLAGDLGIRIIQLAGYDVYYGESNDKTRRLFLEGLKAAVKMAAAKAVLLAFETMETELLNTVNKAMDFVRKINSPYLKVYPDCGNITNAAKRYGGDELADLRSGEGSIAALHLKETLPGKFREIPYGTGHVNFEGIIAAALSMNVRMFVTEFWYTGETDYRASIRASKDFIDKQFEKASLSYS